MTWRRSWRRTSRTLLTGLLAALPLIATLGIVVWLLRLLYAWLGPDSFLGHMAVAIGVGLTGSVLFGYLLSVVIVVGAIFALGLLVEARLERGLARVVNALVRRIPFVRNVYDMVKRFVDLLSQREQDGLKSMSAVWCRFGEGGVMVLGLLSTPKPAIINGQAYLAVLVPTAPVPVGGGLLYVREEWVTPAEVGMDAVTSIYVSMGVTSPQHLPGR